MECSWKCRSQKHARLMNCAVTKLSPEDAVKYLRTCHNSGSKADHEGRTPWHVASACGKVDILKWLVENSKGDINTKDKESGWTALHRALFYGQLECARYLISVNASLKIHDAEGLTALDLVTKDICSACSTSGFRDGKGERGVAVHTWGNNWNYNLGHQGEQGKSQPTIIESFRRKGIHFTKVAMAKYHTAFLTSSGAVYMCGHGRGGRLGLGHHSPTLEPQSVECPDGSSWKDVSVGRDHSLLLSTKGSVYGCGINDHHQLDSSDNTAIWTKPTLVNRSHSHAGQGCPVSVHAGRYHSLIMYSNCVLTFGLNGGQLGHKRSDTSYQRTPRVVSALDHAHDPVSMYMAACSDAASAVVLRRSGGSLVLFLLYDYKCKRIKRFDHITSLSIHGGQLDHMVAPTSLKEKGGSDLFLAVTNSVGQVFLWRESSQSGIFLNPRIFARSLWVTYAHLTPSDILLVTNEGQLYTAPLSPAKEDNIPIISSHADDYQAVKSHSSTRLSADQPSKSARSGQMVVRLNPRRVAGTHRCTAVVGDGKGHNFAVLQRKPRWLKEHQLMEISDTGDDVCSLYDFLMSADAYDGVSDINIVVDGSAIPAHRYYLCARSEFFSEAFPTTTKTDEDSEDLRLPHETEFHMPDGITRAHVEIILKWVYSDEWPNTQNLTSSGKQKTKRESSKKNPKGGWKKSSHEASGLKSPELKFLMADSRGFLRPPSGKEKGVAVGDSSRRRGRKVRQDLYDVVIVSSDEHGGGSGEATSSGVSCHRCVLSSSLHYFNSLLGAMWSPNGPAGELSLPIPMDILTCVIDYLYDENDYQIRKSKDVEFLVSTAIVADQLLMLKLKALCESALLPFITLRSVSALVTVSCTYGAEHLKAVCMDFICANLPSLLESRELDELSDVVMSELTQYNRAYFPCMAWRTITPFSDAPSHEEIQATIAEYEATTHEATLASAVTSASPNPVTVGTSPSPGGRKKGRQRRRRRTVSNSSLEEFSMDGHLGEELPGREVRPATPNHTGPVVESFSGMDDFSMDTFADEFEENEVKTRKRDAAKNGKPSTNGDDSQHREESLSNVIASFKDMVLPGVGPTSTGSNSKGKLSQKERKRLQRESSRSVSAVGSNSQSSPQPIIPQSTKSSRNSDVWNKPTPVDIPITDSHKNEESSVVTGGVTPERLPVQSPTSPTFSLLDIMSSQRGPATDATALKPQPAFKPVPKKGGKLSQRERKRLISNSHSADDTEAPKPLSTSATPAWGRPAERTVDRSQPVAVPSLRDVMDKELEQAPPAFTVHGSATRPSDVGAVAASPPPFHFPGASSPPMLWESGKANAPTLREIIDKEKKDTEAAVERANKSLHLIQLEDRAMQDLLEHYSARKKYRGETITVERDDRQPTAPNWAAVTRPNLR